MSFERKKALDPTASFPLRIVHLRKVFQLGYFASSFDKVAVADTCLVLEEGKL